MFRDISRSADFAELVEDLKFGREASMHAEDLVVYRGSNGETVEALSENLPELYGVPSLALVVEAVNAVDGGAFVVASEEEEVLRVLHLVGEEEADGLQTLFAAVDVVTEEEVVGLGRVAAVLEETQQVVELAVDVSANVDGGLEFQEDGLGHEDQSRLLAQPLDFLLL